MKKLFYVLPFLLGTQIALTQSNLPPNDQFFSIILEIDQDDDGQRTATLISSQIHEGRLKRPTKSDLGSTGDLLLIDFLNETKNRVHQLRLNNALLTDYEFVNEDEELTYVMVPEKKKSYHIRIPYHANIMSMDIYLNDVSADKLISSFSLQNN